MSVTPFQPITKEQAAEILGVSIRSIENYVSEGEMPAPAHLGRRVYWHPDIFYSWLDALLRRESANGEQEAVTTDGTSVSVPHITQAKEKTSRKDGTTSEAKSTGAKALKGAAARSMALLKRLEQDG